MRHYWEAHLPHEKSKAELFMGNPHRKCKNCGAIQERVTHHSWMRVTGYQWLPKAGKCKPVI